MIPPSFDNVVLVASINFFGGEVRIFAVWRLA